MGFGLSNMNNTGGASKVASGSGQVKTGYQITSFSNIALGSNPVAISNTNLKAPNGYPASNIQLNITVTDTTGATNAPSGVASIESAFQQIAIIGASGRIIWSGNGTFGEIQRWQQILNDNQAYSAAPTPADSSTSTAYSVNWNINLKHLVIDNSESPFEVVILPNTLSSRATTLNGMTSTITSVQLIADFVPVANYQKTQYRTKPLSVSSTGYYDVGTSLDNRLLYAVALDVGTDAKLNSSNTFLLSENGTTLVPYTPYTSVTNIQNSFPAMSSGASNHISGFFPIQTLYKAAIDGSKDITLDVNLASAPTGGGQANTLNLYQAEGY